MEQLKEVKVVFCDYNSDSFALANAKISNVNLYKKTNRLEIFLLSDEIIPIGEIEKFDNYVRKRFNLKEVSLKITLPPDDRNKRSLPYEQVRSFLSKNVAVIKAFLKNSTAEVKDGIITLHLCVKGKVLLEKQGIHNYISEFIKNTYDSNYRVEFVEDNYGEIEQNFDKAKEDIIKEFAESSARAVANKAANNEEEVNRQSENSEKHVKPQNSWKEKGSWQPKNYNQNNANQSNGNQNGNNNGNSNGNSGGNSGFNDEMPKGKSDPDDPSLIFGRNSNIREPIIKVADIGMDTTDAQIIGEIVNVPDPTELKKTGKFLYSFDVYDGTSTITCKCFVIPDKKDKVGKRLKPGTGVKVGGKAGFDNFAKEITILANTIVEGEPLKKIQRMRKLKELNFTCIHR